MNNIDEAKKKKPYSSKTYTTGDPAYNDKMFNKYINPNDKHGSLNNTSWEQEACAKAGTFAAPSPDGASSVSTGGDAGGDAGGMAESLLSEETLYSNAYAREVELPKEVHLIPQAEVIDAVADIEPIVEQFTVGYVTPVFLYGALVEKFTLLKCTQLTGTTGEDYIEARADSSPIALAQRIEIARNAQYAPGDYGIAAIRQPDFGSQANRSADYDMTNKLVSRTSQDPEDNGDQKLNTILFYPIVGQKPKVTYFLDFKDDAGYIKCDRPILEKTLYRYIEDVIDGLTPINKSGKPGQLRWGTHEFRNKLAKMLDADAQTVAAKPLDAEKAFETRSYISNSGSELKPPVRALYTNQIYYLSTASKTLGAPVVPFRESLTEAKRYVRRYYIRPQNIFCSNKSDILKALIDIDTDNCSIYTLNNLGDEKDITKLTNKDIIYYYDDGILYDKNHVKIMDYDLAIKHEEERDAINVDKVSDKTFSDVYSDRMTDQTVIEGLDKKMNLNEMMINRYKYYIDKIKNDFKELYDETQAKLSASTTAGDDYAILSIFYSKLMDLAFDNWELDDAAELFNDSNSMSPMPESVGKQLCKMLFNIKNLDVLYDLPYYEGLQLIQNFISEPNESNYKQFYEDCKNYWVENFEDHEENSEENQDDLAESALDLEFDDVNAYGEILKEGKEYGGICCICGEDIDGYGNNPEPYMSAENGRCCDACNLHFVIPARLRAAEQDR